MRAGLFCYCNRLIMTCAARPVAPRIYGLNIDTRHILDSLGYSASAGCRSSLGWCTALVTFAVPSPRSSSAIHFRVQYQHHTNLKPLQPSFPVFRFLTLLVLPNLFFFFSLPPLRQPTRSELRVWGGHLGHTYFFCQPRILSLPERKSFRISGAERRERRSTVGNMVAAVL